MGLGRGDALVALLLALLVALLFVRSVGFTFVGFDDDGYLASNPMVQRGLDRQSLAWAFTTLAEGHYHPLTWVSHMAAVQVFGLAPGWHHAINVALHACNAALFYALLIALGARRWPALTAAALWAAHPLRVESVAWVSERKDVQCALFVLLCVAAYLAWVRRRSALAYCAALLSLAAALLSKPMAVTVPAVLLVLDAWPLRRWLGAGEEAGANVRWRARLGPLGPLVIEKLPFLALSAASAVMTLIGQRHAGAMQGATLGASVENALVSCVTYVGQTLAPLRLAVFYPFGDVRPGLAAAALAALVAITLLVFRSGGDGVAGGSASLRATVAVGWLLFLGTLVPVIGLPQVGGQSMADRFTYLPGMGLAVALVWGARAAAHHLARRRTLRVESARAALVVAALASTVTAAGLTGVQLGHWRNTESLFRHALAVVPDNFMAHNNLAVALDADDRIEEAEQHFREAVRLNPGYPPARIGLGSLLARRGDYQGALAEFGVALARDPGSLVGHYNTGLALAHLERYPQAEAHYRRALEIDEGYAMAHLSLGAVLAGTGRAEEGALHLQRAAELSPGWDEPRRLLANLAARR